MGNCKGDFRMQPPSQFCTSPPNISEKHINENDECNGWRALSMSSELTVQILQPLDGIDS